jgi:hypothetical protein
VLKKKYIFKIVMGIYDIFVVYLGKTVTIHVAVKSCY